MEEIYKIRQRVTRLEEKSKSDRRALKLARESVSKNNLGLIATFILAVLGVILTWLKH
jgi:hypothetical protein